MKKLTYEKAFFLIIGILILPSLVRADLSSEAEDASTSAKEDDFILSGYTEAGKRSTAEDYEEEGTDDDYTYQNYHLKLEQEVSERLSYDISSFIYKKDYKSRDSLDNISRLFKINWSYYLRKLKPEGSGLASDRPQGHGLASYGQSHSQSHKEDSLKLDFKLRYKEKRYKNTPSSEYDQISAAPTLTFKKKDLWTVDLTAGIDNYDYLAPGEKDQLKIFGKIGADRYFLEKKLMLTSSYKLETTEQKKIDRKRTKQEILGGFDYIFNLPWIYKIVSRVSWGQRDTKEEEERDEDFDYEYWQYYTKTEHRISPKLKTALKYQFFKKDYISADLDHRGFYIQNSWDYEILDDEKQRIGFDFGLQHKDVKYELKSGNDYQKETAEVKLSYKRKKNWQTSIGLEENFYDFDDSSNDKKRTYVKLSGEKLFFEGDLVLSLDLKYRYTDYKQKDDKEQEAVRIAFEYRF